MNIKGMLTAATHVKRDTVLFTVGLVGIVAESFDSIVRGDPPEPMLIYLFGAMVGLPVFLNVDEARKHQDPEAAEEES